MNFRPGAVSRYSVRQYATELFPSLVLFILCYFVFFMSFLLGPESAASDTEQALPRPCQLHFRQCRTRTQMELTSGLGIRPATQGLVLRPGHFHRLDRLIGLIKTMII